MLVGAELCFSFFWCFILSKLMSFFFFLVANDMGILRLGAPNHVN